MDGKTWNIGEFQIFLGIHLILYENIEIVCDNTNMGLKVDQIRGEIRIWKDFDGTLSRFHTRSTPNFFIKVTIYAPWKNLAFSQVFVLLNEVG